MIGVAIIAGLDDAFTESASLPETDGHVSDL